MYLLDTVVISALRRPERHAPVAHWLQAQAPQTLYISVVTVGEIMYGAARQRRAQPAFAQLLERWLETVMTSFHDRVLPLNEAAAKRWGLLHAETGLHQFRPADSCHRAEPRLDSGHSQRTGLHLHRSQGAEPIRWKRRVSTQNPIRKATGNPSKRPGLPTLRQHAGNRT